MGFKAPDVPRLFQPELGGGALLDIGIYILSFASMVFGGTYPSSITSTADMHPKGADFSEFITLRFQPGQYASLYCTLGADTPCEVNIIGTKGRINVSAPFWCTSKVTLYITGSEPQVLEFPLPASDHHFNFKNSVGLNYEAIHVQKCISEGKTSSEVRI
jgi:dihydrodiol dehydrogenase / D-xylose 1-dehydrogenase (NADP)